MKNLSLLIIAFAFCCTASAQSTSDTTHHRTHHQYSQTKNSEHYVMQDGKLMMDKNGTMSAVNSDVTLSNGTTITTDGKVTWKSGKTQTLENGERIGSNGHIWGKMNSSSSTHKHSSSTHHMHNMKNNADSTH